MREVKLMLPPLCVNDQACVKNILEYNLKQFFRGITQLQN